MLEGTPLNEEWVSAGAARAGAAETVSAVERAVREHSRLVYRVAWAILRNHHDAEDATQEVFLRVLKLRRELEGVRSPKTWLARIAFRVALDRRPRRREVPIDDGAASPSVASLADPRAGADDLAASAQVQALLGRAIAALPDDLRHAVQLSTLEELNSSEIATLLGIPEGTVRTRLMRARGLLREALSPALGARHEH
jgi:RNA polymerase sigma-70 factor (ECF subfamily)